MSVDRAEFIRVAIGRAAALPLFGGAAPRTVHFGDTPNDVRAALAVGALPVGLATGAYSLAQLRAAAGGATAILLDGLDDTQSVLRAIGA